MQLRGRERVLFLGGEERLPSVRIRCQQIARSLGCDYLLQPLAPQAIPPGKDVFVLVKWQGDRAALRRRGVVIWDVIDSLPPVDGVDKYLYSTACAREFLRPRVGHAPGDVIPHHHCNVDRVAAEGVEVLWIGGIEWLPTLEGSGLRVLDSTGLTLDALAAAYRSARVLLNLRRVERPQDVLHCRLASGIKLINAIGFGLPSLCSDEPAYREIGPDCMLLTDAAGMRSTLEMLLGDTALEQELRSRARARAELYHLDAIVARYARMLGEHLV
ncbi:MAG: hypothetical protein ABI585_07425 [Betaproteobacteria bacterium]